MIQVVQQTREEKIAMYRKMKKRDLAEMLVNANEALDAMRAWQHMPPADVCTTPFYRPYTLTCATTKGH